MVITAFLAVAILGGSAGAADLEGSTPAPSTVLPAEWAGDFGIPCAWGGTYVWLYADINDGHGRFARNAVVVGDQFMIQPLVGYDDNFYWPTDCTEQADGSLLVAALEVINRPDLANDGWAFEIVDTDMFVVREPDDPASWTIASKLGKTDAGWWDLQQVEFSDQWPGMAFARDVYGGGSYVYIDGERGARLPDGDGVFAPIQAAYGWYGYSWDWDANTATLWTAVDADGPWTPVGATAYGAQTHAHGLNVIDGELWHRYSVIGNRPEYEQMETL